MRHVEDERRLAHEEDNSRLHHEAESEETTALVHVEPTEKPVLQHEESADNTSNETDGTVIEQTAPQPDALDPDADADGNKINLSSKALHFLNKILPDDRDNETVQAIKHDILETPAAIIDAMKDIEDMRNRGQRLFFENKDKNDEVASNSNNENINEPATVEPYDNSANEALEEVLAQPEPVLSLPPGKEAVESIKDNTALVKNENSLFDGKNDESASSIEVIEQRCYYEVLGISQDADESEIKNAYRALAKKCHPDVNSGDKDAETKFKELNEAYSVLGDPEKRQVYDQKIGVKTTAKSNGNRPRPVQKGAAEAKVNAEPKTASDKNEQSQIGGNSDGKQKDRFMRQVLDRGYIFTQAAAHLMPDEQRDEDSGTKGVRAMLSEGAKLVKIFATAERKPKSTIQHDEDDERLTHEDVPEESRLEHEANVLQHEELSDGEATDELSEQKKVLALSNRDNGEISDNTGQSLIVYNPADSENITGDDNMNTSENTDTEKSETDDISDVADDSSDSAADSIDIADVIDSDTLEDIIPQSKNDIKIENKIDKNIDKLTAEAAKLEKKIEKAEKKIPKKKVKKSKLVHDEKTGKSKRQISFADEKIDRADAKWNQGQSRTLSANTGRYVTGHASAFVHGKVSENENLTGNTGLKAVHTGEKAAVKTYQTAKRVHRYVKNAPYRKLHHLKMREAQNKGKLAYQQLLKDKPELRKNTASRLIQKRRIKREYAKAFRAAQSGGQVSALGKVGAAAGIGAAAVSGDGKALAKMGAKLTAKIALKKAGLALVKAAAPILLKIGLLLLILGAVLLLFTMCFSIFSSSTNYILDAISYAADADDITGYSVYMTQLEVELKEEIIEAVSDVEGLHEFRLVVNTPSGGTDVIFEGVLLEAGLGHPYNIPPVYTPPDFDPLVLLPFLSDITHNPFEIMAYLTAVYGDFTGHDINAILREIFETAFTLEIVESFEVRSAVVECWYYDADGFRIPPFSETMLYNWYYREVSLTINKSIIEVLQERMNSGQQEHYGVLMESHGLQQFAGSPFEGNWLGNVSSNFGYRFHPITLEQEMHNGIDIAMPEGTPIMSGAPGTVTFAGDMGSYGNTVIIEYFDLARGVGVRILYAHLHEIDVTVGDTLEIGEIIGTVGSTGAATGTHLHMEVSINEDGGAWRYINPLFFVELYKS